MVAERFREARAAFDSISGLAYLAPEGRLFLEGLLDYLWERES